jgi:hypothetical protein
MTAVPPEPDFSPPGNPPEPPTIRMPTYDPSAYQPSALPPPPDPSPQDLLGPPRPRKMSTLRIIAGVMWAVIAVICAVGAVLEWTIGLHAAAALCLVIAIGSGWYDYRVWRFKTRRLIL